MNEQQRRELIENYSYTWDGGVPCSVGGWQEPEYASIVPATGGMWRARWVAIRAVAEHTGNIPRSLSWFVSDAWMGYMTEAEATECRERWRDSHGISHVH